MTVPELQLVDSDEQRRWRLSRMPDRSRRVSRSLDRDAGGHDAASSDDRKHQVPAMAESDVHT